MQADDHRGAVPSRLATDLRAARGKPTRRLAGSSTVGDLTSSRKSALSHLERNGPATVSALARIEGVRPFVPISVIRDLRVSGGK